jgi:hypothetical protein
MGATKIEDLAGELKNSTFFSVAPPSLILCAKPTAKEAAETKGKLACTLEAAEEAAETKGKLACTLEAAEEAAETKG